MIKYSEIANKRRILNDLKSLIGVIEDSKHISTATKTICIKVLWYVVEMIKDDKENNIWKK